MDGSKISMAIILGFSALHALFTAFTLVTNKRGNLLSNRILALVLVLLALIFTETILKFTDLYKVFPHFIYTTGPLWFLLPPLIYFYIKTLLGETLKLQWQQIWHLLPFIYILSRVYRFYPLPGEIKIELFKESLSFNQTAPFYAVVLFDLQLLFYIVLYILFIKKAFHTQNILHHKWIKFIITFLSAYLLLSILNIILVGWTGLYLPELAIGKLILFSIFVFIIAYLMANVQQVIFPKNTVIHQEGQHHNFAISTPKARRIISMFESQKIHTDINLTLSLMANNLSISERQLSKILRQELNTSFTDLLNTYRVAEVKKALINPQNRHLTIFGIARECGFNSKASFNRIFKNHTGLTPSEFIQNEQLKS